MAHKKKLLAISKFSYADVLWLRHIVQVRLGSSFEDLMSMAVTAVATCRSKPNHPAVCNTLLSSMEMHHVTS